MVSDANTVINKKESMCNVKYLHVLDQFFLLESPPPPKKEERGKKKKKKKKKINLIKMIKNLKK